MQKVLFLFISIGVAVSYQAKASQRNLLESNPSSQSADSSFYQSQSEERASLKVRNNFVTELFSTSLRDSRADTFKFSTPRNGWVFFSAAPVSKNIRTGAVNIRLDNSKQQLQWRTNPDTGALEAMQLLDEGEHNIQVKTQQSVRIGIRPNALPI